MGWLKRIWSRWIVGDGDSVHVGRYYGVVAIGLGGVEALYDPESARIIARRIIDAADEVDEIVKRKGITAGRLPEGKVTQ